MKSSLGDWLETQFVKWQAGQGGRRTIAEFAKYLGVSRGTLDKWMNATRAPEEQYVAILAVKLGTEIYGILGSEQPDLRLYKIMAHWGDFSEDAKRQLTEEAEQYIVGNPNELPAKVSKRVARSKRR